MATALKKISKDADEELKLLQVLTKNGLDSILITDAIKDAGII